MKFSRETLEIFTAISRINAKSPVNGAVFKEGSRIKARRYRSDMPVLYANIQEEFPRDFGVYDLPKFIALFSVLDDPDVTFSDNTIDFKSGKKKATMRYVMPRLIEPDEQFFERELVMRDPVFQCDISKETMKSMMDAASMFQAPQLSFRGDGDKVFFSTSNVKNTSADALEVEVGESDWKFNIILDISLLQFIRRDYTVSINKKGLLEWKTDDLQYFITMSDKSKV